MGWDLGDAYKFVLSCIASGDCEDPVKLARDVLAEGADRSRG